MSTYTTLPKVSTLVTQKLEHYLNDARIEENFDRSGKLKLSTNFPRREIQELKREYFKAYAAPEEEKKKQYLKSLEEQERERQKKDLERLAEELQLESESKRPVSKKSTKSLKSSKSISGKSYTSYKSYSSYYTTKSTIKSIGLPAIVPQKPVPIHTGKINPILYDFPRRKTTFTEAERVAVSANDIYTNAKVKEIQEIYRYREKDHSLFVDVPGVRNTYKDPAMKFRLHLHFGTVLKAPKLCKDFAKIYEQDEKDGEEIEETGVSVGVDGKFKDILPKRGGDTSHLNAMLGLEDQESEEEDEYDGRPVIIEVESDPGKVSDDEIKSTSSRSSKVSKVSKHSRSSKASKKHVELVKQVDKPEPEASKAPTSAEASTLPSKIQSESTTRRTSVEGTGYEQDFESVSSKTGNKSYDQDRKKVRKHRRTSQGSRGSSTSSTSRSSKGTLSRTLSKSKETTPAPESMNHDASMSKETVDIASKKSGSRKGSTSSSSSSSSVEKSRQKTPNKKTSSASKSSHSTVTDRHTQDVSKADTTATKSKDTTSLPSKKSSVASQKSEKSQKDGSKDTSTITATSPNVTLENSEVVNKSGEQENFKTLDKSQEDSIAANQNDTTLSSETEITREADKSKEKENDSSFEEQQKPPEQKTPLLEVINQEAEENDSRSNEEKALDSTASLDQTQNIEINNNNTLDSTETLTKTEASTKDNSQIESQENIEEPVQDNFQAIEASTSPIAEVETGTQETAQPNILTDEMLMQSSQTLEGAASSTNTLNATAESSKPQTPEKLKENPIGENEQTQENPDVPAKGMYDYTPGSTSDFYMSGATTPSIEGGQERIAGGLEEDKMRMA